MQSLQANATPAQLHPNVAEVEDMGDMVGLHPSMDAAGLGGSADHRTTIIGLVQQAKNGCNQDNSYRTAMLMS